MVDGLAFVGRERELGLLGEALAAIADEDAEAPRVVLVSAEAGAGKTTLIGRFAAQAVETVPSLVVAKGTCDAYTGHSDPYLPFRELLVELTGARDLAAAVGQGGNDPAAPAVKRPRHVQDYALETIAVIGPDLVSLLALGIPGSFCRLVDAARRATDNAERLRLYSQADTALITDRLCLPLLYERHHFLVRPWVRSFPTSPQSWWFGKDVVLEAKP